MMLLSGDGGRRGRFFGFRGHLSSPPHPTTTPSSQPSSSSRVSPRVSPGEAVPLGPEDACSFSAVAPSSWLRCTGRCLNQKTRGWSCDEREGREGGLDLTEMNAREGRIGQEMRSIWRMEFVAAWMGVRMEERRYLGGPGRGTE